MNRKKLVVLSLLVVVIFTLTACLLVACNDNPPSTPEDTTIEETEGLLITNSDFKVVDTTTSAYPRRITSWTGSKSYSTSLYRDDVTAGAISLADDLYNANKSAWDDSDDVLHNLLKQGGRYGDDDEIKNALLIYMPEKSTNADGDEIHGPTAYRFTSSSFTLQKGSYYKLSIDVLTHNIKGDGKSDQQPGARIYVSSNTYAEFASIDTQDQWKTYEIYFETSPSSSTSLTVELALGKYTASYTTGLTTGYAVFDNVMLECLDDEDTDEIEGKTEFEAAKTAELSGNAELNGKAVQTATLKVPNGRFDFGSTSPSSSGTPNSWSLVVGNSGKDDAAPNSKGYNGIIDLTKFAENFNSYSATLNTRNSSATSSVPYKPAGQLSNHIEYITDFDKTAVTGSNVFMLSQQYMTAQSIRSSRTITIEKGKTYALSIWLYAAEIHGDGVSLILTGSDGKNISIKGIARNITDKSKSGTAGDIFIGSNPIMEDTGYDTGAGVTSGASSNAWMQYTFYIRGNQYKDYSYNMNIWLGTEGTSSNYSVKFHNFTTNNTSDVTYRANGTFSTGWLFVDDLQLNEITDAQFEDAATQHSHYTTTGQWELDVNGAYDEKAIAVDLQTDPTENVIGTTLDSGRSEPATAIEAQNVHPVGQGVPAAWTSNFKTDSTKNNPLSDGDIYEGIVDITDAAAFENSLRSQLGEGTVKYPELPYSGMPSKNAYMVYASSTGYYEVESEPITITANRFYRLSFWLKTSDIKTTSGAYVYLLNKTQQAENIANHEGDDEVTVTSFTRINTADYDTYLKDWVEINIVIRGGEKDTDLALKFTLGTGDRFAYSTRTSGAMFVANFNMNSISYANYSDTSTSTYTKSVNLYDALSSSGDFNNSSFNSYDPDDDHLTDGLPLVEQDNAAAPENWTVSDNTIPINGAELESGEPSDVFAGIIALNRSEDGRSFTSSHQAETATGLHIFDNFYGDPALDEYYSDENLDSIAGPNMLAIGTKGTEGQAIGFASDSLTLSSNTYYQLSIYARTQNNAMASILLSGESSSVGENSFILGQSDGQVDAEGKWTKFTFYIEVGKASVSIKLNLWLGLDKQYQVNVNDLDDEEFENSLKSTGAVFFDNIVYKTIDEDTYNSATENDTTKAISFMTDSFDALSSTVESRGSLTTPNGWTGAAGTNQSSANTKGGVIYADDNFYENKLVDGVTEPYVGILGKDYDSDSIEISQDELDKAMQEHGEDISAAELLDLLQKQRRDELKRNNWIPVSEMHTWDYLTNPNNRQLLVINNMTSSAYTYTSSTSTFKEDSYYKVSLYVRTYGIGAGDFTPEVTDQEVTDAKASGEYDEMSDDEIKEALITKKTEEHIKEQKAGAYVELYLGSANETDKPMIFEAIVSDEWQLLTFYVRTRDVDVTSVNIRLSLGKYISNDVDGQTVVTGLTNGYAMFDDVKIEQLESEVEYEAMDALTDEEKAAQHILTRYVKAETSGTPTAPEENTTTPSRNAFNLEYLWWMVPTIVLGVIIIAVVIVFVVRKVRKPSKQQPKRVKKTSAPVVTETLNEKHDKYDTDKE